MRSREGGGVIRTDRAGRSGGRVRLPGIRAARSGVQDQSQRVAPVGYLSCRGSGVRLHKGTKSATGFSYD